MTSLLWRRWNLTRSGFLDQSLCLGCSTDTGIRLGSLMPLCRGLSFAFLCFRLLVARQILWRNRICIKYITQEVGIAQLSRQLLPQDRRTVTQCLTRLFDRFLVPNIRP